MKVHKEIRSFILGCLFRATSQGRRNEFQSGGAMEPWKISPPWLAEKKIF